MPHDALDSVSVIYVGVVVKTPVMDFETLNASVKFPRPAFLCCMSWQLTTRPTNVPSKNSTRPQKSISFEFFIRISCEEFTRYLTLAVVRLFQPMWYGCGFSFSRWWMAGFEAIWTGGAKWMAFTDNRCLWLLAGRWNPRGGGAADLANKTALTVCCIFLHESCDRVRGSKHELDSWWLPLT